jgi:type IV pilus assembly protein PilM
VGAVRMTRERGRWALGAASSLSLPEGAVKMSMLEGNVVDASAFRETVRAVLERAGIPLQGAIGLVLPDPVARVSTAPASEFMGKDSQETEELLRFRLRKAVPFEIKDAKVAFLLPEVPSPDAVVVAAAVAKPVLEGYEEALSALGLHPGLVELSGLALLSAVESGHPSGDRLVVNWDEGYVSLLLARGGQAVLVRTLTGEAVTAHDDVVREVANTVLFYREKLGGAGLDSVVLRSALLPASQAADLLSEPLGVRPEIFDPWSGQGEGGPQAQAVAGAAACLVGKTA